MRLLLCGLRAITLEQGLPCAHLKGSGCEFPCQLKKQFDLSLATNPGNKLFNFQKETTCSMS